MAIFKADNSNILINCTILYTKCIWSLSSTFHYKQQYTDEQHHPTPRGSNLAVRSNWNQPGKRNTVITLFSWGELVSILFIYTPLILYDLNHIFSFSKCSVIQYSWRMFTPRWVTKKHFASYDTCHQLRHLPLL